MMLMRNVKDLSVQINLRSNERDNFRGKGQVGGVHVEVNIRIMWEKGVKGKKKPINRNTGEILRCNICESIFHFVRDCPDYVSVFPKKKNEVKLQYTEKVFHTLSEETAIMAVLDSECTKTVCRKKWLSWYLELLLEDDKKQVIEGKSDPSFRFWHSEEIKAIKIVEIPARIVGHCTSIKASR